MAPINYNNAFTPNSVVGLYEKEELSNLNIPVYQRLFVWDENEINQLLEDLWCGLKKNEPYYIGIFTVVQKDKAWEIVDGQQRLTFLSLFAAYTIYKLQDLQWHFFLFDSNDDLRIQYVGRKTDREALIEISKTGFQKNNEHFGTFLRCIDQFLKTRKEENPLKTFSDYIFDKASFLVSMLPKDYSISDLNLFFEIMNSSGKQLTPVEQIKGLYFPNHASDYDTCLNFEEKYQSRDMKSPSNDNPTDINKEMCFFKGKPLSLFDILKPQDEITDSIIIKLKKRSEESVRKPFSSRSILSPEVFLLHSLIIARFYSDLPQKEQLLLYQDRRRILESYSNCIDRYPNDSNDKLCRTTVLNHMKEYRQWLDDNIIFLEIGNDESNKYRFRNNNAFNVQMMQFQSMLYVSSGEWQGWVLNAYLYCKKSNCPLALEILKGQDKTRKTIPDDVSELSFYKTEDRYWFWKLDYILWEEFYMWTLNKQTGLALSWFNGLTKEEKAAILSYRFQRNNRSREHLHPQDDEKDNNKWDKDIKDCFGNLALISPSFNSAQGNDLLLIKSARMQSEQINKNNLESIKLLLMFKIAEGGINCWTQEKAEQHGRDMFNLLKDYSDKTSAIDIIQL